MHVRARRHEKIPARPLLIDYGLAGMGLVLSPIDSGFAEVRLASSLIDYGLAGMGLVLSPIDSGFAEVRLASSLIDYGLAGMRLMASTSSFLPLRPPFLPLMEEKEQKKIKASGTPAKLAGVDDGNGTTKS